MTGKSYGPEPTANFGSLNPIRRNQGENRSHGGLRPGLSRSQTAQTRSQTAVSARGLRPKQPEPYPIGLLRSKRYALIWQVSFAAVMAESKHAPAGKRTEAPRSHHPTKNQCAWIKKGTKALGTLHLGGKLGFRIPHWSRRAPSSR